MDELRKRKAEPSQDDDAARKTKGKKLWRTPRQGQAKASGQKVSIEPGDAGIFATCDMGKESKCVNELRDLFEEYAEKLYSAEMAVIPGSKHSKNSADDDENDIEGEIEKEIDGLRKPASAPLFMHVKLDIQCVMFFKTQHPVEPTSFVHAICSDAVSNPTQKRTRFIKRLTPMTLIEKATVKGLDELAQRVLPPHFSEGAEQQKFAIRPSLRNHNSLTRDEIIRQVALAVGARHKVDLKGYDKLILVEVFKNVCGMSVVNADFDKLKRYNLAEIYEPMPKEPKESKQPKETASTA